MIIVTGAAGFIGSNIVMGLNRRGTNQITAVDDLSNGDQFVNLARGDIADYLHKDEFRQAIRDNALSGIEAIIHQGACSDTTERDGHYMMDNNYRVTRELFHYCQEQRIPFIYASSAAVYGAGPHYIEAAEYEAPLNVYGYSKYLFDQVLRRHLADLQAPVVGLRYFNVYGPNEQHKGRMASVASHNMQQYRRNGSVRLFGGWDGYADGAQQRDFVYVDDVVDVNLFFLDNPQLSGIFNCGTGQAQPFNDVAHAVINGLRRLDGKTPLSLKAQIHHGAIEYIPFPDDLKGRYQSHTQADLTQLRAVGYTGDFKGVADGVNCYIDVLAQRQQLPTGDY